MLLELSIRNVAIIDDLTIRFQPGLTILSGETGAGKSVIINAVNLLLGARANAALIRTGAESAEIEALFQIHADSRTARVMEEQDIDPGEGLIIRRLISATDRHRVYINGRLATMQLLNLLTENLASISSQHAHQSLLKEEEHLRLLDQFGGLTGLRGELSRTVNEIRPMIVQFEELEAVEQKQSEQTELLRFQKSEIEAAAVSPGEDDALEKERLRLKNSELLYQSAYASINELYSSPGSVLERMVEIRKRLEKAAPIDGDLTPIVESMETARFQLEDITETLRKYLQTIPREDHELLRIEERLHLLQRLKRKYGGSLAQIFSQLETIDTQLSDLGSLNERIENLRERLSDAHQRLASMAKGLSDRRMEVADRFARQVEAELSSLRMGHTRFKVAFDPLPIDRQTPLFLQTAGRAITDSGMDRVHFLMAPNPGEALKPLSQIASGGELSRVVLALKAMMAQTDAVETLVFDEVDAGIGGGTAEVVGQKLAMLSRCHQIICITHLPQIAKFGNHHYKIEKQTASGRTQTTINELDPQSRVEEMARMLGGVKITQTTIQHARELLKR